jgi:hypothetical protein
MELVLVAKDLWDVVDGTEGRPEEPESWDKRLQKALADWICLTLMPSEQKHVIDCTSPKDTRA